jgi:hypothetical protein
LVRDPGLKAACPLRGGYWSPPNGAGVCLGSRAEVALGLPSDGNRPDFELAKGEFELLNLPLDLLRGDRPRLRYAS